MNNKSLIDKILEASENIHNARIKSSSSNWIVTSSNVSNVFSKYLTDIKKEWRKDSIKKIFEL